MTVSIALASWVRESTALLRESPFVQADLDEFMPGGQIPRYAARVAVDCFRGIIEECHKISLDADALLTIPLEWSVGLTTVHPTLDELLDAPWGQVEVPGLYLLRPDYWRQYDEVEEYRCPMETQIEARRRVAAYYRSFISIEHRGPGAEYPRVIYIRTA